MDLAEVKDLIKSLLSAAGDCCTIQELLIDFEEETGFELPHFNFYNPRDFLLTLTDIIRIYNSVSGEWIRLMHSYAPRNQGMDVRRRFRSQISQNERPDFLTRNVDYGVDVQQHDISLFVRAYQMGWITLNESGRWEKVESRRGLEQNEIDADNLEFLFSNVDRDDIQDIEDRRATVRGFLSRLDFVRDPVNYPAYARPIYYPLPYTCASDEVQNDLKQLMMFQTDPVPWRELPDKYRQFYNRELSHQQHGYRTLLEMVKSLKDIFRCVRLKQDDWILFDASKAPDPDERCIYIWALRNLPNDMVTRIMTLIDTYCENTFQPGIRKDDFLAHYYKKYRKKLEFTQYGFPDFKSLLNKLNGKILRVEDYGPDTIIKPLIEKSKLRRRTIFTLCPGDDAFKELFPIDCIDFGIKYREVKPLSNFILGRKTKVNVADIYSPHKFYIRIEKYKKYLTDLMTGIQHFYKYHENKYRMPAATIRPHQICVALYTREGRSRWYRAIILKVPDKNNVVVSLVDYGPQVKLDNEYVRFLHRKFYSLPKQAFFARIQNVKSPTEGRWPRNTRTYMRNLLSGKDLKFQLMKYEPKAEILSGVLFFMEEDGLVSVTTRLAEELGGEMRFNENVPYDAEEDAGPCWELVPVIRPSFENRSYDLQPSDIEPSDDFDLPNEVYESSGMSSPELMEIIFDRLVDNEPFRRMRSLPFDFYNNLCPGQTTTLSMDSRKTNLAGVAFTLITTPSWLPELVINTGNGLFIARGLPQKILTFG